VLATPATSLELRFEGFTLALRCGDPRLTDRVAAYFRPFLPDEAPAAGRVDVYLRATTDGVRGDADIVFSPWGSSGKESFAERDGHRLVRKDRTGVLTSIDGARWSIDGDLHQHFSQLINLIGTAYGTWLLDRGSAMIHASAVVRDGRALAIAGDSGLGKSSVAVRLLERGFDFLTNDRLIVEPAHQGVVAHGLPKLPRVNPGTLLAGTRTRLLLDDGSRARYDHLSKEELWGLEEKRDLDVQASLGRRWLLSAPLSAVFILAWRSTGDGLDLHRLRSDQALQALRSASKTFGAFDRRLSARTDLALEELARTVPVFRASGVIDPTGLADGIASGRWPALGSP
jgi:HprK-related kinase B